MSSVFDTNRKILRFGFSHAVIYRQAGGPKQVEIFKVKSLDKGPLFEYNEFKRANKNRESEMVTRHAQENAEKYLNPQFTNRQAAGRFQAAIAAAMSKRGSTAVVLALDTPVSNPHRDDWAANDRLVGIIRHHDLVTVMLSRAAQINRNHLRTDKVKRL